MKIPGFNSHIIAKINLSATKFPGFLFSVAM